MKCTRCAVVAVLIFVGISLTQERADVALVLENTTQKYCQGDDAVGILQISGRFRYQNVSRKAILLLRHLHDIGYIRLRPEPRVPTQKPEYTISSSTVLDTLNPASRFRESDFIRLEPNETYSEQRSFSFPFLKSNKSLGDGLVTNGTYMVDVLVTIWPDTPEEAERLGKILGSIPIATQSVWSNKARIEVHSDAPAGACSAQ